MERFTRAATALMCPSARQMIYIRICVYGSEEFKMHTAKKVKSMSLIQTHIYRWIYENEIHVCVTWCTYCTEGAALDVSLTYNKCNRIYVFEAYLSHVARVLCIHKNTSGIRVLSRTHT